MGFLTRAQIDAARARIAPNGFRPAQAVMDVGRRPAFSRVDVGRPIIAMRPPGRGPAKIFEDISFKEAFDVRSGEAGAIELRSDAGIFENHIVDDAISRVKSEAHGLSVNLNSGAINTTVNSIFAIQFDSVLEAISCIVLASSGANVDWVDAKITTPNGMQVVIFAGLGANRIQMAATSEVLSNETGQQNLPVYLKALSAIELRVRSNGAGVAQVQWTMLTQRALDRSIRIQRAGA